MDKFERLSTPIFCLGEPFWLASGTGGCLTWMLPPSADTYARTTIPETSPCSILEMRA
jgi:hypothetical protein